MKRLIQINVIAILLVTALAAADSTGTWKGEFDFNGTAIPLQFNLKASGGTLSGTVEGLPTSPATIKDGKIQGDSISFWLETDYDGQTYKLVYKGQVSAAEIHFTFGTEDGSFGTELVAKKAT
jgi:hypothetical protein